MSNLRNSNSDISSSSISINSSDSGNSTSRTLISSSSINSSYPSSVNSSRNGSISSGSSKNSSSSRALAKTSIVSITSLLAEDTDDSSNLINMGSMSNGFVSRVTVPFVPTHGCNIVPGKTGSLYLDAYNTTKMYMDKGKDEKNCLNDKLHNPIWITPSTENHTCLKRETCQTGHCKCIVGSSSPYPKRRPDFTLASAYRAPKPPQKWYQKCPCKCGTITILTCTDRTSVV